MARFGTVCGKQGAGSEERGAKREGFDRKIRNRNTTEWAIGEAIARRDSGFNHKGHKQHRDFFFVFMVSFVVGVADLSLIADLSSLISHAWSLISLSALSA
jgi:hypothetical protein